MTDISGWCGGCFYGIYGVDASKCDTCSNNINFSQFSNMKVFSFSRIQKLSVCHCVHTVSSSVIQTGRDSAVVLHVSISCTHPSWYWTCTALGYQAVSIMHGKTEHDIIHQHDLLSMEYLFPSDLPNCMRNNRWKGKALCYWKLYGEPEEVHCIPPELKPTHNGSVSNHKASGLSVSPAHTFITGGVFVQGHT